jgi:magnesium-transporting ATPase (P-type)
MIVSGSSGHLASLLADNELSPMVIAISEGRRIYDNVRWFLLFGMSGGAAEIMVMLAGPFLEMPLPLLPAQILDQPVDSWPDRRGARCGAA